MMVNMMIMMVNMLIMMVTRMLMLMRTTVIEYVKICQLQSILHSVIDKQVQMHHCFDILMQRAGMSTVGLGPRTLLLKTLSSLFLLTSNAPISNRLKR